jgi:hypothetical protein
MDCSDLYREMLSFPVDENGQLSVQGGHSSPIGLLATYSRPVQLESEDRVRFAGLDSTGNKVNLGGVVAVTDHCNTSEPPRLAVASLTKVSPCEQCFACPYSGEDRPINLRKDLPVRTRAHVQIIDAAGGTNVTLNACYPLDCKRDGVDERACYGWLPIDDNCGGCDFIFPNDPRGHRIANWRGYSIERCNNCVQGERDIYYSVEATILCYHHETDEDCRVEYYLLIVAYVTPRILSECPPTSNCIGCTLDGPLCGPEWVDWRCVRGCSLYSGCIKLDKVEYLCGAVNKRLTLSCATRNQSNQLCDNPCTVEAIFSGIEGNEPFCIPCFDLEGGECPDENATNPREDVAVAGSLEVMLGYPIDIECCGALIDGTTYHNVSCAFGPYGCPALEPCEDCCIPENANLIGRWRSDSTAYSLDTPECGEMALLGSTQVEIYCWVVEADGRTSTCYGIKVNACLNVTTTVEECCNNAQTPHCLKYSGCAKLQADEQCGGRGRFPADGVVVDLSCAEDGECRCGSMQAIVTLGALI